MYCKNCGAPADESSLYCNKCGTRLDNTQSVPVSEDRSSFGFALLGFFIPLAGLIFFLVYESKKPKRAKSAGKGALIGFITEIILSIVVVILYVVLTASLFQNIADESTTNMSSIGGIFNEENLEESVDVTFGEFKVSNNGYYSETSLEITVRNKAEKQCSYYITIEAVDENGARIETDMIYADRLNSGQETYLTAFEYVEQSKIEKFQNATFKVLEIDKYDF